MRHAEPELLEVVLLADSGEPKDGDTRVKLGKLVIGDAISHRDFCDGFVTLVFLDLGGGADSSSDSSCLRYLLLGLKHKGVSFET